MEWSPRGGMMATVHRQGVALWGGQSFGRLMRVGHPGVQRLLFSPCERYMLTFSEFPDNRGRPHVSPRSLLLPTLAAAEAAQPAAVLRALLRLAPSVAFWAQDAAADGSAEPRPALPAL